MFVLFPYCLAFVSTISIGPQNHNTVSDTLHSFLRYIVNMSIGTHYNAMQLSNDLLMEVVVFVYVSVYNQVYV